MAEITSDQISIVDITDAYSVNLTQDTFSFSGDLNGNVASQQTVSTVVQAKKGDIDLTTSSVSIGNITPITGVTISPNPPTSLTINMTISTSCTGGSFSVPITIDGEVEFTKTITISVAKTGQTGQSSQWYSGTGITGTSTTATSFSGSGVANAVIGDMYLNTSTYNTYRCTVAGTPTVAKWIYVNNIKGTTGDGAIWYNGTGITGTSTTATSFSGSGVANAIVGDMYLNTSTYNTYRCTVAGTPTVAKWIYVGNIQGGIGPEGKPAIKVKINPSFVIFKNNSGSQTLTASVTVGMDPASVASNGTVTYDGETIGYIYWTKGSTKQVSPSKEISIYAQTDVTTGSLNVSASLEDE